MNIDTGNNSESWVLPWESLSPPTEKDRDSHPHTLPIGIINAHFHWFPLVAAVNRIHRRAKLELPWIHTPWISLSWWQLSCQGFSISHWSVGVCYVTFSSEEFWILFLFVFPSSYTPTIISSMSHKDKDCHLLLHCPKLYTLLEVT